MAVVVASEFIVVGLLPQIANDLDLSLAQAGQLTALFALSAAVAGPFVTLAVSRQAPRRMLVFFLLVFAAGNAAMAFASGFPLMIVARIVQGAVLPAFISIGAAEVTRLAPQNERGSALAHANIGFVVGVLIALPAGIALAQAGDWRLPFLVLTGAPAAMAIMVLGLLPRTEVQADAPGIAGQLGLLARPRFLGQLLMSAVLFAATFSAYTFLGAWLASELNFSLGQVAVALCLFGAAGIAGNSLAARMADRFPLGATAVAVVALVLAVNAAAFLKASTWAVAISLAVWGLTHTACITLSQVRVTLAGSDAPAFATTMNISAANLGIAIGAAVGGWAIDHGGLQAIGAVPAGLLLVALSLATLLGRRRTTASASLRG